MSPNSIYHLHLVSDSTGETVSSVARACLVQFEKVQVKEHLWSLVRSPKQIEKIALAVAAEPGPVIFTLINDELKQVLVDHCRRLKVPFIPVLDPVMSTLTRYFHSAMSGAPGRQHTLDAEYFARIDAMHYTLAHDDGQALHDLNDADVILVGPSRTSKTPTCVYLANRGIKAANVPLVPAIAMPAELDHASHPLIVGLVTDAERLVQVRRNRLRLLQQSVESEYTDPELVEAEMLEAKRLFARKKWPVVDVSRRSIEETAATVIQMLSERRTRADAAAEAARP